MSRSRAFQRLWLPCILAAACVDGSGPTQTGRAVPLDIRPSFQVDPSLFPAEPVDRIRLVASDVTTSEIVGSADLQVDPTSQQWTLSLGVTLGAALTRIVIVDVELLAGDVVQWSGRLGPITVRAGTTSGPQSVDIHRGSLDNLDVIGLDLLDPPTSISVGVTTLLVANPTLVSGSTVVPTVYWASTSTSVATVTPEGLVATVTGVGAGTTQIVAVAGSVSVELDLEVTVPPPAATKTWVGATVGAVNDWGSPTNWQPNGVPSPSDVVYVPLSLNPPGLGSDHGVGGLLVDVDGSVDLNGFTLTVDGDLAVDGAVTNGLVVIASTGGQLRGLVPDLQVNASRALSGDLFVSGSLTVNDQLSLGPSLVQVLGDLSVLSGTGSLLMKDAEGYLYVQGDATFDGADHSNMLQGGLLVVFGDFTVGASWSPLAFRSEGTIVHLTGDASQTVAFSDPRPGAQAFQDLSVFKTGGSLLLSSDVVVEGIFSTSGNSFARAPGNTTALLRLYGGVSMSQTTFDGLPLRIDTSVSPSSLFLDSMTFRIMPTAETQLYIAVPGDGLSPVQLQSPVFESVPGPNAYYLHVVNTSQQGALLEVQVTKPTPPDQPGQILTEGGPTEIIWPYP